MAKLLGGPGVGAPLMAGPAEDHHLARVLPRQLQRQLLCWSHPDYHHRRCPAHWTRPQGWEVTFFPKIESAAAANKHLLQVGGAPNNLPLCRGKLAVGPPWVFECFQYMWEGVDVVGAHRPRQAVRATPGIPPLPLVVCLGWLFLHRCVVPAPFGLGPLSLLTRTCAFERACYW